MLYGRASKITLRLYAYGDILYSDPTSHTPRCMLLSHFQTKKCFFSDALFFIRFFKKSPKVLSRCLVLFKGTLKKYRKDRGKHSGQDIAYNWEKKSIGRGGRKPLPSPTLACFRETKNIYSFICCAEIFCRKKILLFALSYNLFQYSLVFFFAGYGSGLLDY